ncbi:hypothetical protein [Dysgonomonas sp. ZJ279]|uniref:hypothetical protein n=1 Tax=Dysgonomonas sp. ZJ279 TaxID=2709796 RepID=UPI0013ED6B6B|nr:hypothetical protein [Dysgonomonas sp. ZJ279]
MLEVAENYVKQLPKDTENDQNINLELYVSRLIYENLIEVELNKTLRKHEKDHVIYGKTKLDTERMYYIGSQKIKISIDKLLSIPQYKEKLIKDMTGLIKEGFTIFNTNIPKELIDSIYTINKKSNNENKKQ